MRTASHDLRSLFEVGAIRGLSDGQLLERFLASRDDAAFEVLLGRHGPMVWGVCRRALADHHDAEDAFQATFLVLARKAASIAPREAVGGWLYGVARRTAAKTKAISVKRRARERPIASEPAAATDSHEPLRALAPFLDQELSRLPDRYRLAIVLCELEGLSRREAARQLGWAEGTVASRLARGRALLAGRLTRRGLAVPFGAGAVLFSSHPSLATEMPRALLASTARAARPIAIGQITSGVIPTRLAVLAQTVVAESVLMKALITTTAMALGIVGAGLSYFANASGPPQGQPKTQAAPPPESPQKLDAAADRLSSEMRSVLDRATASVRSIADLDDRVWLLCAIARLQARTGPADVLEATLKSAIEAAHETESEHRLVDVAEVLARAGNARVALELVQPLELNRDSGVDRVAAELARAGDVPGALRAAGTIAPGPYKGEAYATIAIAQAESGDEKGALATIALISDDADLARVFTTIAARQYRTKDPAAAQSLARARQAADRIPLVFGDHRNPSDSRPSALAEITGVLAGAGAIKDAREVATEIKKSPWDDFAWRHVVGAQAQHGETKAALESLDHIKGSANKGEALKDIVAARVGANDLAMARALAGRIEPGIWRIDALIAIAKGLYRSGARQEGVQALDTVLHEAETLQDNTPRIGSVKSAALWRIAKAQAELRAEKAALVWIDKQPAPAARAWALMGLAEGMAERLPPSAPSIPRLPNLGGDGEKMASKVASGGIDLTGKEAVPKPIASFLGKLVLFGVQRTADLTTSRIEMINPDGTGLETVLNLGEGQWICAGRVSPDGKCAAYSVCRNTTERAELWLVTTDRIRRKIDDNLTVAAWSPDGRHLAGFRARGAGAREWTNLIIDVETGQAQALPVPKTDLVEDWSPDGKSLAVMGGNVGQVFQHPTKGTYPLRQIYLIKPDGSGREALSKEAMVDCLDARFSPDGQHVTYFQRRHPEGRVLHFAVVQGRDGSGARDLAQFDEIYQGNRQYKPNGPPCWSPDGKSVVWFIPRKKVQSSSQRIELLFLSVDTGRFRRLELYPQGLQWVQAIDWR